MKKNVGKDAGFVESRSINYVPTSERRGRVWHQALFWFTGNFNFFTIAIGFVGPSQGLGVSATVFASVLGLMFGTTFMALHASQGPDLGLPQLIQSRAQFGFKGVIVPLLASLFTFLTFNVVDTLLVSQGLSSLTGVSFSLIAVSISALAVALAIYGYDWLHRVFQVLFWISLPIYSVICWALLAGHIEVTATKIPAFTWLAFAAQFAVSASYNITFAPYVSDYTRYLPRDTPRFRLILCVYLGAALSSIWLIALGAWLAAHMGAIDGMAALKSAGDQVVPLGGSIAVAVSVCALVAAMSLNAYSGMLTLLTTADMFRRVKPSKLSRILAVLFLAALWLSIAFAIGEGAVGALYLGLTLMLYVLVPWSAINLVDYFFLRRRLYAISQLQSADGLYGQWNALGLTSYLAGLIIGLPFYSLPGVFTGFAAERMGGADLAWLPELVVAGALYYFLNAKSQYAEEWRIAHEEQTALEANSG